MSRQSMIVVVFASLLLTGCATEPSGRTYSQFQTRTAFDVAYGEVVDVRIVKIEGSAGLLGTWGGASIGRAIGVRSQDRWRSRVVAGAVGGVAGAVAGRAVQRKLSEDEGLEITVQLDNADAIAVVQADDVDFVPGDRVRVLLGRDGSARVSAL